MPELKHHSQPVVPMDVVTDILLQFGTFLVKFFRIPGHLFHGGDRILELGVERLYLGFSCIIGLKVEHASEHIF